MLGAGVAGVVAGVRAGEVLGTDGGETTLGTGTG